MKEVKTEEMAVKIEKNKSVILVLLLIFLQGKKKNMTKG